MKIAILLAGQVRSWNVCSKVFELYNNIFPDIEFDFFLSTWDDNYDEVKYDMDSYSFITKYEFHDQKEVSYTEQLLCHAYLCQHANNLKNKYAKEHNIEYDCVIATRPDIFFSLDILSNARDLILRSKNYKKADTFILNKNVVYTGTGVSPYRKIDPDGNEVEFAYMSDLFVLGTNYSVDKFSNFYDNISKYKFNNRVIGHVSGATYLVDQKIMNCRIEGFNQIIRPVHNELILNLYKNNKLQNIYDSSKDFRYDFEEQLRELKTKKFDKSTIKMINPYTNEINWN